MFEWTVIKAQINSTEIYQLEKKLPLAFPKTLFIK